MRQTFTRILFRLVVLSTTCGALLAANPADRTPLRAVAAASPLIHPANTNAPPSLVTIYSNLGSSTDAYDDINAWLVTGPNSSFGESQWIAMPFTPKANSTVTKIKIAVENGGGTNGFTLCFGYPNPATCIRTWEVKHLPPAGTCCRLDVVNVRPGIKVKKGKQYWIVAMTDSTNADALDSWPFTWNDSMGSFAYNINNQGWTANNGNLSAFGVFGRRP
jgi:hypothetical protein